MPRDQFFLAKLLRIGAGALDLNPSRLQLLRRSHYKSTGVIVTGRVVVAIKKHLELFGLQTTSKSAYN